jgi:hypothetical protein
MAQNSQVLDEYPTKELLVREERMKVVNLIKNPAAEDFDLNGYIIDKRAVQYYHPGSLNEISLEKARKINFLYLKSFQIINEQSLSEECLHYMKATFDTGRYNHLRKWDEPVQTEIRWKECIIDILLMSWNQIDQQYNAK